MKQLKITSRETSDTHDLKLFKRLRQEDHVCPGSGNIKKLYLLKKKKGKKRDKLFIRE